MPILNISLISVGKVGVKPRFIAIETNDSEATVTSAGYLNAANGNSGISFQESDFCWVITKENAAAPPQVGTFKISYSGGNWSLVPPSNPGDTILPTTTNNLAYFTNAEGTLSSAPGDVIHRGDLALGESGTEGTLTCYPTTAARGSLVLKASNNAADHIVTIQNASMGQSTTLTIPDTGGATSSFILSSADALQTINTDLTMSNGDLQVSNGSIRAGQGGTGGFLQSYSNGGTGILTFFANDNGGGIFGTTVTTATSYTQNQTITIPDAGASTANFLLDTGANNVLSYQTFVGVEDLLLGSGGTWNIVRIGQGNYALRHTVTDESDVFGIDVTPMLRTASGKGFRLESFDVIYGIGTGALDAHTVTLDRVEYANNAAVSVTSVGITGTLATAVQANPYVTNIAVNSPAFENNTNAKYVVELNIDNSATSLYDLYGLVLNFSQTIA